MQGLDLAPDQAPKLEQDQFVANYHFELPEQLIAQRPVAPRDHSRLLVYHVPSGEVNHAHFFDLPQYLPPDSALILNDSKVFPCRLKGKKVTGGQAEIFLLSATGAEGIFPALIKCSGKKRPGDRYIITGAGAKALLELELVKIEQDIFWLAGNSDQVRIALKNSSLVPIPPYIRGGVSNRQDVEDYQTLYAKRPGSVAAPTAGLHFTPEVFCNLAARGIPPHYLTLHVGHGTFAPIKAKNVQGHFMHRERFFIPPKTQALIQQRWGKLFCVGTTCLRALESLARQEGKQHGEFWETDIFLYPGGPPITSIKGLITNFHLPQSSLFVLVCALVGRQKALQLYQLAIAEGYRFFSYGDAMLVLR